MRLDAESVWNRLGVGRRSVGVSAGISPGSDRNIWNNLESGWYRLESFGSLGVGLGSVGVACDRCGIDWNRFGIGFGSVWDPLQTTWGRFRIGSGSVGIGLEAVPDRAELVSVFFLTGGTRTPPPMPDMNTITLNWSLNPNYSTWRIHLCQLWISYHQRSRNRVFFCAKPVPTQL